MKLSEEIMLMNFVFLTKSLQFNNCKASILLIKCK